MRVLVSRGSCGNKCGKTPHLGQYLLFAAIKKEINNIFSPKIPIMKKLNTIIWSLLLVGIAYGQPCSDLLISEIIFGKQGSSLNGGGTELAFNNYSVELFNPTDAPVDLSDYKVELISLDSVKTEFSLHGTIGGKETYVLSNPNASFGVTNVTDTLTSFLDFEDKVLLQLTQNGEPIDVIGRQGVEDEVQNINIDSLLNDPAYLQSLGLDLRSVENLTVRRRPGVQEGKTEFLVTEILQDWAIYPHYFIDHLGQHLSVCTEGTIEVRWEDVINQGTSFIEDEEANLTWVAQGGEFIAGTIELNGTVDENITMLARPVQEPPLGSEQATQGFNEDFEVPSPFTDPYNEFTIPAFSSSDIQVPVCEVFDDSTPENHETATFRIDYGNTGSQTVFIGFPEVFWVGIIDDDGTSTIDLELQNKVTLFPTVSNHFINLTSEIPNLTFKGVYTFSVEGKHEKYLRINDTNEISLNISDHPIGYHVLIIYTSEGVLAKRFIKH